MFAADLTSLEHRRDQLSRSFDQDICQPSSCLYHLTYFPIYVIRLSFLGSEQPQGLHALSHVPKYCSFINYALNHYEVEARNN